MISKRQKRTIHIQTIKSQQGCKICEEHRAVCLDFHHVEPGEHISKLIRDGVSMKTIEKEIRKCVVLCANCHRLLHAGLIDLI